MSPKKGRNLDPEIHGYDKNSGYVYLKPMKRKQVLHKYVNLKGFSNLTLTSFSLQIS
jgi:hypothetical protein